jgi:hypothetical protein
MYSKVKMDGWVDASVSGLIDSWKNGFSGWSMTGESN